MKSDVKMPGTIKPPRSKVWRDTFANVLARGGTPEQAKRMADAVYQSWKRR